MRERPIIFNQDMVKAILDGRKTQTRRVVKVEYIDILGEECIHIRGKNSEKIAPLQIKDENIIRFCPFGCLGGELWVRETWAEYDDSLVFRASNENLDGVTKWKPSIHMPRWASRIQLRITNVRVERLNDISEEDAKSEGIARQNAIVDKELCINQPEMYGDYSCTYLFGEDIGFTSPLDSFKSLWESINGKGSWNKNPFVWVIEFEVIK